MATILQLVRHLDRCPADSPPGEWRLRHFAGPADVDLWLALREAAFARSLIAVRRWTPADFEREITSKPWWRPEALWFVESVDHDPPLPIGTAMLARRGPANDAMPVIHWMAVQREFRRRGVGRLLVAKLEQLVWQAGGREIALETHVAWTAAVAFYRALGYREAASGRAGSTDPHLPG